jgi:chromosome segregation ATPase
MIPILK